MKVIECKNLGDIILLVKDGKENAITAEWGRAA